MRRLVPIAAIVFGGTLIARSWVAGGEPRKGPDMHRVVLEITADGQEQWSGVLNNAENVRKALGADRTQVQVVVHGGAIGMLLAKSEQSELARRIAALAKADVIFSACQNTMNRKNLKRDDLLPEASVVDSGVAEVVRKQEAGWSYVKAGH